jgi:hypothetical protein
MLADLVLVLHAAFVLFVVGGLAAIWIGAVAGWRWVTRPGFRGLHLAAIGFVAVQSALATTGFVQRWVAALLYWEGPAWAFTALHLGFAALVAWTWLRVPPR